MDYNSLRHECETAFDGKANCIKNQDTWIAQVYKQ